MLIIVGLPTALAIRSGIAAALENTLNGSCRSDNLLARGIVFQPRK
jgi:hypothetical protein